MCDKVLDSMAMRPGLLRNGGQGWHLFRRGTPSSVFEVREWARAARIVAEENRVIQSP